MDFREFLKMSKGKIVLTIPIFIVLFYLTSINTIYSCPISGGFLESQNDQLCLFDPLIMLAQLPFVIPFQIQAFVVLVTLIIVSYIISCLIIFLNNYRKSSPMPNSSASGALTPNTH